MAQNPQAFAAMAQNPQAFEALARNPQALQALARNAQAFTALARQPAFAALARSPAFAAMARDAKLRRRYSGELIAKQHAASSETRRVRRLQRARRGHIGDRARSFVQRHYAGVGRVRARANARRDRPASPLALGAPSRRA